MGNSVLAAVALPASLALAYDQRISRYQAIIVSSLCLL
jgi:hypothetical protein